MHWACSRGTGVSAVVVIDNAHRLSVDAIRMVADAQPSARLVLLTQPWPDLCFHAGGRAAHGTRYSVGAAGWVSSLAID